MLHGKSNFRELASRQRRANFVTTNTEMRINYRYNVWFRYKAYIYFTIYRQKNYSFVDTPLSKRYDFYNNLNNIYKRQTIFISS